MLPSPRPAHFASALAALFVVTLLSYSPFAGALASLAALPAWRFARAFWLGTDQPRTGLAVLASLPPPCSARVLGGFDSTLLRVLALQSPVAEPPKRDQLENLPGTSEFGDKASSSGVMFSRPIKTNLRVAESSAFLAYVKPSTPDNSPFDIELQRGGNQDSQGNFSNATDRTDNGTGVNIGGEEALEMSVQYPMMCFSSSNLHLERRNDGYNDASGTPPVYHFPYYYPGMIHHSMALHSVQNFHENINNAQAHTTQTSPQPHGGSTMPPFQYNLADMSMQSIHLPTQNVRSSVSNTPIPEETYCRSNRRAAALAKFRQKRKDRCCDKKVRYASIVQLGKRTSVFPRLMC